MRKVILYILTIAGGSNLAGQDLKFDRLLVEDGMTSVNAILIDYFGYRWFGGTHGLYRYDGINYEIFQHNSLDSNSLSYNDVIVLFEDASHNIWIGTSNHGVNLFSREDEVIHRFSEIPGLASSSVTAIQTDASANIWIGTIGNGIFVLEKDTHQLIKKFNSNTDDDMSLSNDDVFDFLLDASGDFWVVTNSGKIDRFDPMDSSFTHFTYFSQPISGVRSGQKLLEYDSTTLWIGTEGKGIFKFNKQTQLFQNFSTHVAHTISNDIITGMSLDSKGNVWIATDGGGLNRYDKKYCNFKNYQYERKNEFSLSNNSSYSLFIDDNDKIWLGMGNGMVNIARGSPFDFFREGGLLSFNVVVDLFVSSNNELWVGTGGAGVDIINLYKGEKKEINTTLDSLLLTDIILSITEDRNRNIWIGTFQGGAYQVDTTGKILHRFVYDEHKNSLSNNHIFDIEEDQEGYLWLATQGGGVDMYNPLLKTFKNYHTSNNSGLTSNRIQTLLVDRKNRLWVGHFYGGVQRYDRDQKKFVSPDLPPTLEDRLKRMPIHALYEDSKGNILIGTAGLGLVQIDKELKKFTVYDTNKGLPSNAIYGILEYNDDYWLSTNNGIVRVNHEQSSITVIDKSDGLMSSDFESGSIAVSKDGDIFFGSKEGVVFFNPSDYIHKTAIPKPILNSLSIFSQPIRPGQKLQGMTVLKKSLLYARQIELPFDHNNFTLSFTCPSCEKSQKVQYRYRLKGLDSRWIRSGIERNYVNYANLNYGKYELLVQASNDQGMTWSLSRYLKVVIHPPYYFTKGAYVVYIIFFIIIIVLIYIFIKGRITLINQLQFEKLSREKDNELNKEKINFFTNVSHEIRTPLTLMLGHLEKLVDLNEVKGKIRQELSTVSKNGNRLLMLVNQLLDFRKMESGKMGLKVMRRDIVVIIEEILLPFKEQAIEKGISVEFEKILNSNMVFIDATKVETILFNLFSNALKFTPTGGQIRIHIHRTVAEIIIEVSNSGRGIKSENLDKIFQPFFQGNAGVQSEVKGTGLGLALVKEVVELHHGDIKVYSNENNTTTFSVVIPADKMYYSQEDIIDFVEDESSIESPTAIDESVADSELQLLIIEDNTEILNFLCDIFKEDYQVITASNGAEGLEKASSHVPDAIISDVMMPIMDGIEMCKHLKQDIRTNHIPILLLTARTGFIHEYAGLDTGADDYITKPFKTQLLVKRVHNLIQSRQVVYERFRKELFSQPSQIEIKNPDEQFLVDLVNVIENNISDPEYTIKDLAKDIGLSHSVLYRKTRALTNLSINDFFKKVRLKRAAQLLSKGMNNINEVSDQVGFSNPKYFSTCFKAEYGKTPTEYSKNLIAGN